MKMPALTKLKTVVLFSSFAACAYGGSIFLDDYDSGKVADKLPTGYTTFGTFAKVGVSDATTDHVSGSMGGYAEVDFQTVAWGAGLAHYGLDLDLTNAVLSVQIKCSEDLSAKNGVVGFRISDADGTVVRTAPASLYTPKAALSKFSQSVQDLTVVDEPGSTPGIDLKHITSVGIVFYKRGDVDHSCRFAFDDLRADPAK